MRTVLITNGNLASMISVGEFLLDRQSDLAGVFVTTRLPSQKSNLLGTLSMLRHSGASYTHFKLYLNRLLPMRMRKAGLPASVEDLLALSGADVPVRKVPDVNAPEVIDEIGGLRPEILVSFSATQKFCNALIETPSRVAVNAHYALLPGYAGLSPYFWYLHQGEPRSGVTLHQIVPRLDAGPLIEQQSFDTVDLRTVAQLLIRQMDLVSPLLLRFYDGKTSEHNATPQDLTKRSYFRHPTRQQVREFRGRGFTFVSPADTDALFERARRLKARAHGPRASAALPSS